jgi:Bacterial SH3 domain
MLQRTIAGCAFAAMLAGAAMSGSLKDGIEASAAEAGETGCTPVLFPPNENTLEINGTAPPESSVCYSLGVDGGSTASVELVTGRNVMFSIPGLVDAQTSYEITSNGGPINIQVSQLMRSAADEPFRLRVTLSSTIGTQPTGHAPNENSSSGASAQTLDVAIFEHASDGQMASCSTSTVSGLKVNGDGFLAVRSGPGSQYKKIDELHNGDVVTVYDTKGKWFGVMYGRSQGGCNYWEGEGKERPVQYDGNKGWVHSNWLKPLAG